MIYKPIKSIHHSKMIATGGYKLYCLLPPLLLIILNLFLYGPFEIYRGNMNEFTIPLITALKLYILPAVIFYLILSTLGLLFPEMYFKKYVALLLSMSILIWLQGNILLWDYGLADGR